MANLRSLPKIDRLASDTRMPDVPQVYRVEASRQAVREARDLLRNGESLDGEALVARAADLAWKLAGPSLSAAINATGVVLHTGLGRARLADSVVEAIGRESGHCLLEIERESGRRGDRQVHVEALLRQLTGCEAALVVNNCAAAVLLVLTALAKGREVILSRGQMVEIGGSFRLPEIVEASGCRLVEVGCTNRTRAEDYTKAIGSDTAAILRCHPSNFAVVGFTEEPDPQTLQTIAEEHGILFVDDMGSGCLVDLSRFGLPKQETLREVVSWASIATASADKLLGGPQAGLIVGRKDLVKQVKRHPLARAVRPDKLALLALESTLRLYIEGRELEVPVLRYLSRSLTEIEEMACRLAKAYGPDAEIQPAFSQIGGGSLPGERIPTFVASLGGGSPDLLAKRLRKGSPPIFGRIEGDRVLLDPRTMESHEVWLAEELLCRIRTKTDGE